MEPQAAAGGVETVGGRRRSLGPAACSAARSPGGRTGYGSGGGSGPLGRDIWIGSTAALALPAAVARAGRGDALLCFRAIGAVSQEKFRWRARRREREKSNLLLPSPLTAAGAGWTGLHVAAGGRRGGRVAQMAHRCG
jgi:hypothetical protein